MRLKISGIGKIGDSEIVMNGITVIAGENGTGKSTFGKALYCMFNAFCNAEAKTLNERAYYFYRILNSTQHIVAPIEHYFKDSTIIKIIEETKNIEGLRDDHIRKRVMDAIPKPSVSMLDGHDKLVDDVVAAIRQSLAVSDKEIQKTIVSRYFGTEFEKKFNHVNKPNSTGNISLIIQGKSVDVSIKNNICSDFDKGIDIGHNALYMDTPFVMDDIEETRSGQSFPYFLTIVSNPPVNHRQNLRHCLGKKDSNNTIIEEVITHKKIANGLSSLYSITNGEFLEDMNGLMFRENGLKEPIPLPDISAGIKTFLIIRRLLELGEIKERDVLIFDEPEIHLHPSWQLQFAEVLVLLQKEFNLTILLATHSPYFVYALEVYSKKHGAKEQINFYLAENNGDISDVREVTESIDTIYKLLAAPFQKLEDVSVM